MSKDKSNYYLTNKELLAELKRCREELGYPSEELGAMFIKLAERMTLKKQFVRYSQEIKNDLISNALVSLTKGWDKFDPEKSSNPFAFFSSITFNAFLQHLNAYYRQKNIKNELTMLDPDGEHNNDMVDYYYRYEVKDAGIKNIDLNKEESFEDFGKEEGEDKQQD